MKLLYIAINQSYALSGVAFIRTLAQKTGAQVKLLYVAEKRRGLESGKAILAEAEDQIAEGVDVSDLLRHGEALDIFMKEIKKTEYDFVVLEMRRQKHLLDTSQKALIQKIIHKSPIPVLLLRHANLKLDRILICTGGLSISSPVVKLSANLAEAAGLKATLLHVGQAVPQMYAGTEMVNNTAEQVMATSTPLSHHLHESAEELEQHHVKTDIKLRYGDVAEQILEEIEEELYDLVVVGESGRNKGLTGIFLGDVTRHVIKQAKCAVLIVK
jgi:nucleotide-binding universal stress UspA family protein